MRLRHLGIGIASRFVSVGPYVATTKTSDTPEDIQEKPTMTECSAGPPTDDALRKPSINPMLEPFHRNIESERRLSPHTVSAYMRDLHIFLAFWQEKKGTALTIAHIPKIRPAEMRTFLAQGYREKLARATLQRRIAAIRAWFRFLEKSGKIDHNPATLVTTPKLGLRLPRAPSEEETANILDSPPPTRKNHPKADWVLARDKAILELLYSSGIRVSELCQMNQRDINLESREARVLGKGNKERMVPIGGPCATAVADYLQARQQAMPSTHTDDPLFIGVNKTQNGNRLNPREVQRLVQKRRRWLNLPEKVTPHALRHAFATHLLQAGADLRSIQEMMGHASLSTTQRYTYLDQAGLARAYDSAHPRAKKNVETKTAQPI